MLRRIHVSKRVCFGLFVLPTLGLESSGHAQSGGKRSRLQSEMVEAKTGQWYEAGIGPGIVIELDHNE